MEGIESQGGDEDYTIAPVGSHQSFAAMARCASTPFSENHEGPPPIPNLSNIQADKTANHTPILSNTADSQGPNSFFPDQQNLRYIQKYLYILGQVTWKIIQYFFLYFQLGNAKSNNSVLVNYIRYLQILG